MWRKRARDGCIQFYLTAVTAYYTHFWSIHHKFNIKLNATAVNLNNLHSLLSKLSNSSYVICCIFFSIARSKYIFFFRPNHHAIVFISAFYKRVSGLPNKYIVYQKNYPTHILLSEYLFPSFCPCIALHRNHKSFFNFCLPFTNVRIIVLPPRISQIATMCMCGWFCVIKNHICVWCRFTCRDFCDKKSAWNWHEADGDYPDERNL